MVAKLSALGGEGIFVGGLEHTLRRLLLLHVYVLRGQVLVVFADTPL